MFQFGTGRLVPRRLDSSMDDYTDEEDLVDLAGNDDDDDDDNDVQCTGVEDIAIPITDSAGEQEDVVVEPSNTAMPDLELDKATPPKQDKGKGPMKKSKSIAAKSSSAKKAQKPVKKKDQYLSTVSDIYVRTKIPCLCIVVC